MTMPTPRRSGRPALDAGKALHIEIERVLASSDPREGMRVLRLAARQLGSFVALGHLSTLEVMVDLLSASEVVGLDTQRALELITFEMRQVRLQAQRVQASDG